MGLGIRVMNSYQFLLRLFLRSEVEVWILPRRNQKIRPGGNESAVWMPDNAYMSDAEARVKGIEFIVKFLQKGYGILLTLQMNH